MDLAPWRHGQRPRREGKEGHPLGVVGAAWPDGARGLETVLAGHAPVYGEHAEKAPQSLAGHLLRKQPVFGMLHACAGFFEPPGRQCRRRGLAFRQ